MIRLEYITEFKSPEEIRNKLLLEQKEKEKEKKDNKEEDKDIKEENKEEIKEKIDDKNLENGEDDDNESLDSDSLLDSAPKLDITKVNHELDKKDFLIEMSRKYLFKRDVQ